MNVAHRPRLSAVLSILAFLMVVVAPVCRANVTIYAKFSNGAGNWAGDITRPGITGEWIELQTISFGAATEVTSNSGSPATVSKPFFKSLAISKPVNKISPQFFSSLTTGAAVPSQTGGDVTIEFVQTVGGTPQTIMRLELDFVYFESLSAAAATGDTDLLETLAIAYGAQRLTVWPVVGTTLGTPKVSSWSVITESVTFPN